MYNYISKYKSAVLKVNTQQFSLLINNIYTYIYIYIYFIGYCKDISIYY